ncbi:uncharacterized protein METZ01_LOCUS271606, partial [marine metagenome]
TRPRAKNCGPLAYPSLAPPRPQPMPSTVANTSSCPPPATSAWLALRAMHGSPSPCQRS